MRPQCHFISWWWAFDPGNSGLSCKLTCMSGEKKTERWSPQNTGSPLGAKLNKLLADAPQQAEKLHEAALAFLYRAFEYAMYESSSIKKTPWKSHCWCVPSRWNVLWKILDKIITFLLLASTITPVTFGQQESEKIHFTSKCRSHFQVPSIYLAHRFGSIRAQIRGHLTHEWHCSSRLTFWDRINLRRLFADDCVIKQYLLAGLVSVDSKSPNSLCMPVFDHLSLACILTHSLLISIPLPSLTFECFYPPNLQFVEQIASECIPGYTLGHERY